jgi:hypothetical protein
LDVFTISEMAMGGCLNLANLPDPHPLPAPDPRGQVRPTDRGGSVEEPQALHSETALTCQIAVSREGPLRVVIRHCLSYHISGLLQDQRAHIVAVARAELCLGCLMS